VTHDPFKILLKERVCSLVIKLFSPNVKYRPHHHHEDGGGGSGGQGAQDRPYYPITSKLLRVVSILILEYHCILTTETEIFLSLVHKFLDPDKPQWQHCMALEVIHKIVVRPELLVFLCSTYDKNDSSKVFQDMANGLGAYVQNVMMSPPASGGGGSGDQSGESGGSGATGGGGAGAQAAGSVGPGGGPQPGFYFRNVWKPLTMSFIGGQTKELFLDLGDKGGDGLPAVSDGYGISLAYACILDIVRSMSLVINPAQPKNEDVAASHRLLVEGAAWGLLPALSLLLDSSTDDGSAENILKAFETYASLCGKLGVTKPRDAFLASLCKASLPPHYTLNVLKATPCTQTVSGPRPSGPHETAPAAFESTLSGGGEIGDIRHQVVAVGTPLPTSSLPASAHQGPVMLTAKNLQCMRSILSVAHCHGNILGQSWHIILTVSQNGEISLFSTLSILRRYNIWCGFWASSRPRVEGSPRWPAVAAPVAAEVLPRPPEAARAVPSSPLQ